METQKENLEFLEIPELGIRVAKEISGEMTLIEAEEYCQKNKARLLTVAEAGYIYDNNLIPSFCSGREWLEHYSKKMRQKGFGCFALDRGGTLATGCTSLATIWTTTTEVMLLGYVSFSRLATKLAVKEFRQYKVGTGKAMMRLRFFNISINF